MGTLQLTIPAAVYHVHEALIEGLRYMGELSCLPLHEVEAPLHAPLQLLFELASARARLGGRDRHLAAAVARVLVGEPEAGDWVSDTDVKHTVASFGYLAEICAREGFSAEEQKVVLSAMVAHDCAYPITDSTPVFRDPETRILHMIEGEREFRRFADMVNANFTGFYTAQEVEATCAIIRQHDNPGLRKGGSVVQFSYTHAPARLIWSHREADRLWMLDRGGFALDLTRRLLEDNAWYSPRHYLRGVVERHLEEADCYVDNETCRVFRNRKSFYRTDAGFEIFRRLLRERATEYELLLDFPDL